MQNCLLPTLPDFHPLDFFPKIFIFTIHAHCSFYDYFTYNSRGVKSVVCNRIRNWLAHLHINTTTGQAETIEI